MATCYDSIKSIVCSKLGEDKVWRIKARVMRLWKIPSKFDKSKTAYVEMVLMDDKKTICVTIGTIKDFTSGKSWWYKGCNNCPNAVKEDGDTYKCPNCQWKADNFTLKYVRFVN
ncbi:hypothetical protein PIB30_014727 [Stylosanthes scabra]|uniref:Replication factor A C-terminal domain-containing protein n=1 Tax=Stylosanthes scabra TaxID=79078 RepID=A0ABU6W4W5_9FABA|nr:hypothetical protein [Stylosanthes scabra]